MSERKESHRSFSISFKLNVVKHAEEHGKHKAAKLFGIDRKRVREWCRVTNFLKEVNVIGKLWIFAYSFLPVS